ncbi:MAG: hypothetical protein HY286_07200 [Planctomycetes bacterium]|nr:hypothetical protein [Planctomycetota bacterium]
MRFFSNDPSCIILLLFLGFAGARDSAARSTQSRPASTSRPREDTRVLPAVRDAEFSDRVGKVYSFRPNEINESEKGGRGAELDKFWQMVKGDRERYLSPMRWELAQPREYSYFYLDGSSLLLTISLAPEDGYRALEALTKVDPRDMQKTIYFQIVHILAVRGFDTSAAAFKVLGYADFTVNVPEHFMTIDREQALLYMLLPTQDEYVIPNVLRRYAVEKDEGAKGALLSLAYYTITKEGDALLRRVAANSKEPKAVRDRAAQLVTQIAAAAKFDISELKHLGDKPTDAAAARKLRKLRFGAVGDEALGEIDILTRFIRSKGEPGK